MYKQPRRVLPAAMLVGQLSSIETQSESHVRAVAQAQSSAMALEAMARGLVGEDGLSMGKLGARYLNIAAEQLLEAADLEVGRLPIDVDRYVQEPQAAIDQAVDHIKEDTKEVIDLGSINLSSLLYDLAQKREILSDSIKALHVRLNEIDEDLNDYAGSDSPATNVMLDSSKFTHICYTGKGIVSSAATVVFDVSDFLSGHAYTYGRLVESNCDWLKQHKDNLLITPQGFNEFVFDPTIYLMPGAKFSHTAFDYAFFTTRELPGGTCAYMKTVEGSKSGLEAVDALMGSSIYLAPGLDSPNAIVPNTDVAPLGIMALKARSRELRSGLMKLRNWSNAVHSELWKDAMFDSVVVRNLLVPQANTLSERSVGSLSAAIVKLLNEASGNIGSTVVGIYDDLLRYMEASVAIHVPNHHDGVRK